MNVRRLYITLIKQVVPEKLNKLEICFQKTIYGTYSERDVIRYRSPEKIFKRVVLNKQVKAFLLTTHYKGKHYPVIDLDNPHDLSKLIDQLNFHGISASVYISSYIELPHFWVILDIPHKKFTNALIQARLYGIGDMKYFDCALGQKRFMLRAFWDTKQRKPFMLFGPNQIIPSPRLISFNNIWKERIKQQRPLNDYSNDFVELNNQITNMINIHGLQYSKLKYGSDSI